MTNQAVERAVRKVVLGSLLCVLSLLSPAVRAADVPPAPTALTVERIFGTREFEAESLPLLRWSKRQACYFTLEKAAIGTGKEIVRHDLASGKKEVVVPAGFFGAKEAPKIESFVFSADETKVLLFANSKKVWRQHTRGDYWVFDLTSRALHKLGGAAPPSSLMFAKFSPDAARVAFVRDGNVYVQQLPAGDITALTTAERKTLIHGTGDWVNEEELNLRDGFRWSPDGKHLLVWQFDTAGVMEFHLVNNAVADAPQVMSFAYPKVGTKNSATRLGVIPVQGGAVRWLQVPGDPREHYLPHAEWTPDGTRILVHQFNRAQTELRVWLVDPRDGQARLVMTETDAAWLENDNSVRWLDQGKSFLWLSERTGWRHAYRVALDSGAVAPITQGDFDLITVEALDEAGGWLYYAAAPDHPTRRSLFRVKLTGGAPESLTPAPARGWHTYDLAPDAQWAIHSWSTFTTPPVVELIRLTPHQPVRTLIDQQKLRAKLATVTQPEVEFFRVDIGDGRVLDAWSLKPTKMAPQAKLPLLMYVYGEPHGQTVRDAWPGAGGLWHWLLAEQGFVVASVDNRGTNAPRGRAWRKAVHRQIGILAPQEQAQAVRQLLQRWPFVDPTRVGTWGWSGGGSMSLQAVFRYPELYRTAIALAPVADQRLYNTIYQERYMGLPTENVRGYRDGSPLTHARKLRGNLLLVHGTGDDNCHYQATERLVDELVATGKPFQVLPYPNRSHSINEGANTLGHLYGTMTRYLHTHLQAAHAPAPESAYETQKRHGWTLHLSRELLAREPQLTAQALQLLDQQLLEIIKQLPKLAVAKLQQVPLYFNAEHPGVRPGAEYHSEAGWLRKHDRDPAIAQAVEFHNVRIFAAEINRMPNFVLHELAHAYHDRELPGGFANPAIRAAYIRARESGRYDQVERHFGNGRPNTREKAYALTSPMEYFAETTEAYFGRNDFFPFTRAELEKHDPEMFALLGQLWQTTPRAALPPAPPTLAQQLLGVPLAELAQAARTHGNATRGAVLFFQPALMCAKCHDAEVGTQLGPNLTQASPKPTAEHLLESVLQPSKVIKKGYETLTVTTTDGRRFTGLLVEEKNATLTLLDPAGGKRLTFPTAQIEDRTVGTPSLMPDGLVNLLSDRQQFLDLGKYLIEIADGGPARAKELRPAQTTFTVPAYEHDLDHAGLIRQLDQKAYERGAAIFARVCANCHGTKDQPGSLPTSPRFATHTFKNGSDPHSLYQTLTRGYNLMAPQTWMVPRQKYDVIHYLREEYLKAHNPTQYTALDAAYWAKLPVGNPNSFGPPPASVEPWMAMDYGPSLMNTYELSGTGPNFAYKGIAVRLDAGPGGIAWGKQWSVFDHDTLHYAAAWTGEGFIDWKGIHFNGQHQIHPKIVGTRHVENPVGPGWADPATGRFHDPRPLGRDGRPFGPLPRTWAQFVGTYAYGNQTVLAYRVGAAAILELPGVESDPSRNQPVFTRTLEVGRSPHDLRVRLAPVAVAATVVGVPHSSVTAADGFQVLTIPATATPVRVKVLLAAGTAAELARFAATTSAPTPLQPLTVGGPKRWPEVLKTVGTLGQADGAFAVDTLSLPERNPWNAQLRLTGFDFFPDGKRLAVCTWDGDVWTVSGIDQPEAGLTWQRIASGLFQPLGLKFRAGGLFVSCRDQIVQLHDYNGDGETDFYECFNNDHQVTEHFHEFAMGLQTDAAGNFYYAKSGRHALPALVPQHGTLLKVNPTGTATEIVATGFRAANGVCLNPDGTFFVTDQEGFWTPKNRINKVEPGGFYGNLWGYTDVTDRADSAMKPPVCWITNTFDRSPAELVWVPARTWGPLAGTLLNTSYGMGKIYVVPHETVNGQTQGGMCALPLPTFPTGVMRPRFHPTNGHLYVCGMYAWAGNQTAPGGFYRVRATGQPMDLPIGLAAKAGAVELTFTDALDPQAVLAANFAVKVWGLKRSQNYGSKHLDEKALAVTAAALSADGKTVRLNLPALAPTGGMEISYQLRGADGRPVRGVIHNTIHALGQ